MITWAGDTPDRALKVERYVHPQEWADLQGNRGISYGVLVLPSGSRIQLETVWDVNVMEHLLRVAGVVWDANGHDLPDDVGNARVGLQLAMLYVG